jgi:hypothetical protein
VRLDVAAPSVVADVYVLVLRVLGLNVARGARRESVWRGGREHRGRRWARR